MNSIFHILQHIPSFVDYIICHRFKDTILQKVNDKLKKDETLSDIEILTSNIIFELYRLFKISHENEDDNLTPSTIKKLIGKKNDMWDELNHQDSQEFFTFLISQIQEEVGVKSQFIPGLIDHSINDMNINDSFLNIISSHSWSLFQSREYSPLKNMFDGLIQTNKKCQYCSASSIRFEPFITLSISIPNKTDSFTINECFNHFTQEEQLDSDNKFECEICGLKNQGYTKTQLWKTPKILAIHIKRFSTNMYGLPSQKLNNSITYPLYDFDISPYFNNSSPFINQAKYDLVGVNLHQSFGFGGNTNSGHYTSLVKNMYNNYWYLYNDSHPVKIATKLEHIQHNNAYLLFYYRQN